MPCKLVQATHDNSIAKRHMHSMSPNVTLITHVAVDVHRHGLAALEIVVTVECFVLGT